MRYHMVLLPTYYPDLDPPFPVYYQQILEQVQVAEELGWECFWFTEHHFTPYGGAVPNPAVMIATAAARTSRIRLGSAVSILPLRHPLQIAEDYAMADVASGGRLEFGIGIGNTGFDHQVYGVPPDEARARFEEAAEIVVGAWSEDRFQYDSPRWHLPALTLYPRPVQRPYPPVWVAGFSAASLGWAGRHGYNVLTVAHPQPPAVARAAVAAWREARAGAPPPPAAPRCMLHVRLWIGDAAARAREVAEAAITRYDRISVSRLSHEERARLGRLRDPAEGYDWAGMRAAGRNVYGNPDEVLAGLHAAQQNFDFDVLGVTLNIGGIPHADVLRAMRLFAREVMPAF
jgi:alkanesulfonate monooxygenase SsuD/methylene tetrahydromethanopterin reductase-like flavin-dependent oxidoreductase (luciferase family)